MNRAPARVLLAAVRACAGRALLVPLLAGVALAGWTGPARGAAGAAADGSPADAADGFDASFDRSMLSGAGQNTTDLSRFERGDFVPAGIYRVDIYLNESPVGRLDVRFAAASDDASASPCVTPALLARLGLKPADPSSPAATALAGDGACTDLGSLIPGASMTFSMSDLRLDVSVPQAYMGQLARGYVDPKYWDPGVTAGLLDYNLNSYRTRSGGVSQTSAYLGLNAGLNLGLWHLRHDSSLNWQSAIGDTASRRHWQNVATYASRDLPGLHAQLTLGDSWTSGEVFDSIGVRGMQLATDDRMLPQSQRGYAPTVRGTADSNAKVTVSQNGMVIYQTTVPPGPFAIDDLYATGYGGDLQVSVTEANGRVHTFSVPYASVPQLLRPGVTRFGLAAGRLRDTSIQAEPGVVQASVQRGFSNLLTGYGGMQGSAGYAAALLGGALNTRYGAFAMDVSHARTRLPGMPSLSGESVRLSYSKILAQTGTSLTVAAYRYSTSGYLDLGDAERARDFARRGLPVFSAAPASVPSIDGLPVSGLLTPAQQAALAGAAAAEGVANAGVDRQRNRFSLTLNQRFGERGGTVYLSGSMRDFWNRGGTDSQFQIGYNNSVGRIAYSFSASRERDLLGRSDNRYMATMTVPLGNGSHMPLLTGGLTRDAGGGTQEQATLSGAAGADDQYSYGATATHDGVTGTGTTASVTGGYRGAHLQANAGFGAGSGYSQASIGVAGGVVAYPGGVSFSQPLGDTVAIVDAPGAAGARVNNSAGLRVDERGHAVVPYVSPYILNRVDIDPTGLPLDVQLQTTSVQVAPVAGAVVMVRFATEQGHFLLVRAHLPGGGSLPFGAEVQDGTGQVVGVVGQAGRIMVRVAAPEGRLVVAWQDGATGRTCSLPYRVPDARERQRSRADSIQQIDAVCVAPKTPAAVARSTP